MNKKRWWALAIFLVLMLVWATGSIKTYLGNTEGAGGFRGYWNASEFGQPWTVQTYQEGSGKTLALIKLEGVISENTITNPNMDIYNHQAFLKQLQEVFSRPDIKGVILQVNSPGGGVYESDEIYNRLLELKKHYKKPLVVYMSQEAASGGYYVSMAADKIYANRNTLTGSIGVIIRTYNYTQLANKVGIEDVTFKSGAQKDILNPMRPLNEEEKVIMQALVNESYGYFVDVVSKGRKMERDQVLQLADGRIYSGAQAHRLGLVDELGDLNQAIQGAARLADTSNPRILLYTNPQPNIWNWLMSFQTPAFDILGLKQQIDAERCPEVMYMAN